MNKNELIKDTARRFNLPLWEATSRVEFNTEELEFEAPYSDLEATEIERCIAADLRAGK